MNMDTSDITIMVPPAPPGHPLTWAEAERRFTAMALSRGAVGTACGTSGR